jgi:hypothetical protein
MLANAPRIASEPLTRTEIWGALLRLATLDRLTAQLEMFALLEAIEAARHLDVDETMGRAINEARTLLGV